MLPHITPDVILVRFEALQALGLSSFEQCIYPARISFELARSRFADYGKKYKLLERATNELDILVAALTPGDRETYIKDVVVRALARQAELTEAIAALKVAVKHRDDPKYWKAIPTMVERLEKLQRFAFNPL